MGEKLVVKIGDFGMSRDVYSTDYYRVSGKHKGLFEDWFRSGRVNEVFEFGLKFVPMGQDPLAVSIGCCSLVNALMRGLPDNDPEASVLTLRWTGVVEKGAQSAPVYVSHMRQNISASAGNRRM